MFRHWETLWPFVGAWRAELTLASLGVGGGNLSPPAFLAGLDAYRRRGDRVAEGAAVGFGVAVRRRIGCPATRYFDDNAWLALSLLHAADLGYGSEALELARGVLGFVVSGWTEEDLPLPGGLRWNDGRRGGTRNTCTNGPAAEAALLLYEQSGEERWLTWAVRIYSWVRSALLGEDDLYADHVRTDGTIEQTRWSYNQGTMVGAGVLLERATGEPNYLDEAIRTASSARTHFGERQLLAQPPPFNAVYFANVRMLAHARPDAAIDDQISRYAETMWRTRRRRDGLTMAPSGSPLNASAAMATIDALLGGAPGRP